MYGGETVMAFVDGKLIHGSQVEEYMNMTLWSKGVSLLAKSHVWHCPIILVRKL